MSDQDSVLSNAARIFRGGPIWTGEADAGPVESVLVRDGQIAAVGSDAEIDAAAPAGTEVFNLDGRALLPGFVDAHTHFLTGGRKLSCVNLRDARNREEFATRVSAFAKRLPKGAWIIGGDWDHELWGGELPTREWVDSVTPEHPVWLHRLDIHMTLSNSLALELAGITDDTPDPDGGTIVRDAAGRATGVLKDAAMALVGDRMPTPSDREREGWLKAAAGHALSLGLTQIHDVDGWESLHTYRRVHARGDLPLRAYAAVPMRSWDELGRFIEAEGRGDRRVWWGGLKAFVDGSLGSATAWFHEPYPDDPENTGLVVTDLEQLQADLIHADAKGLQAIVHAIGDRANDWLLDAFATVRAANGDRDRRARIEHAQHLKPTALPRFAELDVIPSVQPAHAADDGRWADARIGPDRARWTYAFGSLAAAGARLAFGSDWTVAGLNPLPAIAAAVTRRTDDGAHPHGWYPQEKLPLISALRCHTLGAAYAGFADSFSGSLALGKQADLVILDQDPFSVDETELSSLRVEYTFVDGVIAYEREASS